MTSTFTVVVPEPMVMAALAVPEATEEPFTFTVALAWATVAVTVTELVPKGTVTEYDKVAASKAGVKVPELVTRVARLALLDETICLMP